MRREFYHLAQLTLQRERAFLTLLSSGDGDVVEAFAGGREEVCVWILQRQVPRDFDVRSDIAIAQLGQNDFQRTTKAVQDADATLQRHQLPRLRTGRELIIHRK